jgi:hypothetical protein
LSASGRTRIVGQFSPRTVIVSPSRSAGAKDQLDGRLDDHPAAGSVIVQHEPVEFALRVLQVDDGHVLIDAGGITARPLGPL